VHIAGVAFPPDTSDTNLGLTHVFSSQACAIQHGLTGTLRFWLGYGRAIFIKVFVRHWLARHYVKYRVLDFTRAAHRLEAGMVNKPASTPLNTGHLGLRLEMT